METATLSRPPAYGNQLFDKGVHYGINWSWHGDADLRQPTAQFIVDFIRDNILEFAAEGCLTEERFIDNAGFLTGWIVGQFLPGKFG